MNFTMPIFSVAIPEICLLIMTLVILVVDVFLTEKNRFITYLLAQTALAITFVLALQQYLHFSSSIMTFSGHYILDRLAIFLKMFTCLMTIFTFVYARVYIKERNIPTGEYYILGLFAVLGMLVMACAYSFLTVFLGLELLSLALYAMVAIQRESQPATEAAMKYFVMGAFASGLLLYGISLVYGATGSVEFDQIASLLLHPTQGMHIVVVLGLIFILVGLVFKLGAVPFHMWVPDVYQGAPTSVTLFISSVPKIAAFGITIRILAEALPSLHVEWVQMLTVIAFLSMFFGNVLAIAQTNIKRMLAYSSIAHIGYMFLGIIAGPTSMEGYSAAMFYITTYVFVAAGGFAIIALLSRNGVDLDLLEDYRGLNARNPWLAFIMLLLMFSMAGVPPTVGFFAKLGLLEALVEAHMVWLAAFALLFSIIGAFYYLRVIKLMYFEEPGENTLAQKIVLSPEVILAISINGSAVLILGLLPSTLIDLCRISLT